MAERVVLITGASSGIGAALCLAFARRGCHVVGTARSEDALAALGANSISARRLDVTDPVGIERCVAGTLQEFGRIDVLVNNAGFGQMGPMLDVSDDQLRAQFETNVVGPLAMVRAVAPAMRAAGGGLIIDIGSVSGLVTTPFSGAYCASKAALHAIDDALRMELAPFGIRVMTVQPGSIQSSFGDAAKRSIGERPAEGSWYSAIHQRVLERAAFSQRGATPADRFAEQVVSKALANNPPPRIRLGARSTLGPLVRRLVPARLLDQVLARRFGIAELRDKKRADG